MPLPQITPLSIPEVLLLKPHVFRDERGYFLRATTNKLGRRWASPTLLFKTTPASPKKERFVDCMLKFDVLKPSWCVFWTV